MYVGNLSYDSTDSDIRELFEVYETVGDVFIVKDREFGRPRGSAFVSMETLEEMNAAIEVFNVEEFDGRVLIINEARSREERPKGGGYNRGGGRRGLGGYSGGDLVDHGSERVGRFN